MKRIALIVLLGACTVNIPHPVTVRVTDDVGSGSAALKPAPRSIKLGGSIAPQGGTITSVQPASGGGLTGGGTAGAITLGLSSAGCSAGYVPTWNGSIWTCAAGSPAGTLTGTLTNGDLMIATGTNTAGAYGGSTPTPCTTGNVMTAGAIAATGALSLTCTAIGTAGGVTETGGTSGFYALFNTATQLTVGHIEDDGSFGNTTEFTNTFNQFDHPVTTFSTLTVGDGTFSHEGSIVDNYQVGSTLSSGNWNLRVNDIAAESAGVGGNVQFAGGTGAGVGGNVTGGEIKLSKTNSTVSDANFDLVISTSNAGTMTQAAKFGHDQSLAVVGALTADAGARVFDATGTGLTSSANAVSLANTAVTPATYTYATLTVDQQGRITSASNGTGPATGTGASTELAVWTGTSTQTGYSSLTSDSSGNLTANTLNSSNGTWTVGVTPASIYTPGAVGIGWQTPGTWLDVRANWGGGKDIAELVMAGPNTTNGIEFDLVRSYGTIAAPTSTDWTTVLAQIDSWGYTTGNAVALSSIIQSQVDQHNSSTAVPGNVEICNTNSSNVNNCSFRVDSAQHVSSLAPGTPTLSSCGTGAVFAAGEATDNDGTITEGSSATGCTMTFRVSWSTVNNGQVPHCKVVSEVGYPLQWAESATALTITNIGPASSTNIDYSCSGGQIP